MFPCLLCDLMADQPLCQPCQQDLPYYQSDKQHKICQCCATIFSVGEQGDLGIDYCGQCLSNAPLYQRAYACFYYAYPINHLITNVKYNSNLIILNQLAQMMISRFKPNCIFDCIMPIPMHSLHLRWRGFNQSAILAKKIAKSLNVMADVNSCRCVRYPKKQTRLNQKQRLRNVTGLFAAKKQLNYQHVLIVDDVMTTGATVSALTKVLLSAGVKKVSVYCCARGRLS